MTQLAATIAAALNGRKDEAYIQGVLTATCMAVGLDWDSLRAAPGMAYRACLFQPGGSGHIGVIFIDVDGNVFVEGRMPTDTLLAARYARLLAAQLLQEAEEREEFLRRSAVKGSLPFGVFFAQAVTLAAHVGRYNGLTGADAVAAYLADREGIVLH